jgi:DNA-binding CsgD family transcriptional regulator
MRGYDPYPTGILTDRQIEIVRLVANGFTGAEIADTLHISERSVDSRKSEIYTALNVRNENEVIRAAICLEFIKPEELHFFGRDYELKPLPEKQIEKNREKKEKARN